MLHRFFVVTESGSVYLVVDKDKSNEDFPSATKIALLGESGIRAGQRLDAGTAIGIGDRLESFSPPGCIRLSNQSTMRHFGVSSRIVALFRTRDTALKCAETNNLKPYDRRWIKSTRQVLREIGDNHPAISISSNCWRTLVMQNSTRKAS